jgi:cytidylate kinase
MEKTILYLIGYGGSGKTSSATYLRQKYNFSPFSFSSVIRDYASQRGIELKKRTDYARTHAIMLKHYGWNYTVNIGLNIQSDRICIDDVRSRKYAECIRQAAGVGIAFDCPAKIRFAHVKNHPDTAKYPRILAEFIKNERDDENETIAPGLEFETAALMESADYHIDASKSLKDTFAQLDVIVLPLLSSRS